MSSTDGFYILLMCFASYVVGYLIGFGAIHLYVGVGLMAILGVLSSHMGNKIPAGAEHP